MEDNYGLLDWINIEMLDWNELSLNPNAIQLLEANQNNINWGGYHQIQMLLP
jgi:hypothetical protein